MSVREAYRWLGNYDAESVTAHEAGKMDILTLAMPIGEANSAMLWIDCSLCMGVCIRRLAGHA